MPTIEIPKIPADNPARIAEVCAIFEKMNSTGVRLSVYDLLTARLYKDGIDLHKLWEQAVQEHDLLNQYSDGKPDEYGVYALRTVALLRGLDVKSATLINFKPHDFEKHWNQAVAYMEKGFERLTATNSDGFGVFDPKWAPYSTMISPLAAMLAAIEDRKLDHRAYKLLRRWYWASVFRERYAGAVESAIYRDYQDFLIAANDPDFEPVILRDARINILESESFSLSSISRVNSLYRAVMCLIALKGAKDFQADDSIEFHTLDDHHLFPKAYLSQQVSSDGKKIPSERINSILNRTLISAPTNRRISRSSPSNYLERIVPCEHIHEIMASHFIDADALAAMQSDDLDAFLEARELALRIEIESRLRP